MRKYVLSASLLTMLAPSALAEGALQYRECRQSGGHLGWFAVSYTVQAGQRTQKSAQDLSKACTRADYEQSRQAAATWGEKWPSLQRQTMDNQRQNTNDASNGRAEPRRYVERTTDTRRYVKRTPEPRRHIGPTRTAERV